VLFSFRARYRGSIRDEKYLQSAAVTKARGKIAVVTGGRRSVCARARLNASAARGGGGGTWHLHSTHQRLATGTWWPVIHRLVSSGNHVMVTPCASRSAAETCTMVTALLKATQSYSPLKSGNRGTSCPRST
jgi:hypothetical protein